MPSMMGKVIREFDAAAAATLRTAGTPITSTAAETGIALNTLTAAYWDNNDQPNGIIAVALLIASVDVSSLDETYVIAVEVDSQLAFGSGAVKEVARLNYSTVATALIGYHELLVSSVLIQKLKPTATHIRVKATLGGSTPSLDYSAWTTFVPWV